MKTKHTLYTKIEQCDNELSKIYKKVKKVRSDLKELNDSVENDMAYFYKLRYEKAFKDPITGKNENIGEILDQLYTYIVTFKGVKYLLNEIGLHNGYRVSIGTNEGADIYSEDGEIFAEVFSSVKPKNNQKMNKDMTKVIHESMKPQLRSLQTFKEWKEKNENGERNQYNENIVSPLLTKLIPEEYKNNLPDKELNKRFIFFYSESMKDLFSASQIEHMLHEKRYKLNKEKYYFKNYERLVDTVKIVLIKV